MNSTERQRHLILDWNGTLIDDLAVAVEGVNMVLAGQGIEAIESEQYRCYFQFPIQHFYQRLGVDFTRVSFSDLGQQYLAYFNEAIKSCSVFPGTVELLDMAEKNNYTISILSASEQHTLEENLEQSGLLGRINHVYGLADEKAKGKIELAQQLDMVLGHPASDAIMIGDTGHDIEVALEFGWRAHSVSHGHQSRQRLLEVHSAVYDSIVEINNTNLLTNELGGNTHA